MSFCSAGRQGGGEEWRNGNPIRVRTTPYSCLFLTLRPSFDRFSPKGPLAPYEQHSTDGVADRQTLEIRHGSCCISHPPAVKKAMNGGWGG